MGTRHRVFPVDAFLRRLTALVPPPGSNLVRFHGLFPPGTALRRCGGSSALRGGTGRRG
ncbi:hypothetical protein D7V97_28580 [Corallococcus sp. CA053C]|uniref:transposase n=1 Tax=Corallococcus sp. CA053C TaxID=2316732 RepID=UPI000EA28FA6|nr:hypothetical protein D7V97_28580 [Corallococcus sp. CA053C]